VFGENVDERMRLNRFGLIVVKEWGKTLTLREETEIETLAVLPKHLHGIVIIKELDENAICREGLRVRPANIYAAPLTTFLSSFDRKLSNR